jgi:ATP-dependent Lon protease
MNIFVIVMVSLSFVCLLAAVGALSNIYRISDGLEALVTTLTDALSGISRISDGLELLIGTLEKIGENASGKTEREEAETKSERRQKELKADKNWNLLPENVRRVLLSATAREVQCDAILQMPWMKYKTKESSGNSLDVDMVMAQLEASHYGMGPAKDEIRKYLFSMKYKTQDSAYVLLLNGQPGTGKTTLAWAITEALGRKSYKINLNGLAEANHIVGSETVWRGSQYGLISKAIIETQSFDPVIILDEIDKCGTSRYWGNIHEALLQLFDPSQNEFRDVFLGISYDISRILFIAISNDIKPIPEVLLNRMRVTEVGGYSKDEQKKILVDYIIPKLCNQYNQPVGTVQLPPGVISDILANSDDDHGIRTVSRLAEDAFVNELVEIFEKKQEATSENPRYAVRRGFFSSD